MSKKKKKKQKALSWRLLPFFGLILILSTTLLGAGVYYYLHSHFPDSSLTGEEVLEQTQDTIPKDVLAQVTKEQNVLGANSKLPIKPTSVRVPILMYHYVEYVQDAGDTTRIQLDTTPYTLEQEIKTLHDAGYTFMTNKELTLVMDGKSKLPKKPILLTFDDGYRDFYTDAYPILKEYKAKATQYVISGFLDQPNHLLTSQLEEISKDGLVEIGAHTVNHAWLKGSSANTVIYEVSESKKMLQDIIHKPVVSFAYPFGAFDQQAIDAVKKTGFTSAVATIPGINQTQTSRYFLYRLRPGGRVGQSLLDCLDHVAECYNIPANN